MVPRVEVRLAEVGAEDLPWISRAERAADTARWIQPWSADRHRAALGAPDIRYRLLMSDGVRAGFVILAGVGGGHRAVELRRLVVVPGQRGRGVGAQALREVQRTAFHELDAHRLWLDVKAENARALALYRAAGFRVEGTLRECLWEAGGWTSLIVMSMLEREWARLRSRTMDESAGGCA